MPKLRCPNCQGEIVAKPEHAGKKVACPHCKKVLLLPAPKPAAPTSAAKPQPANASAPAPQLNPFPEPLDDPLGLGNLPQQAMPGPTAYGPPNPMPSYAPAPQYQPAAPVPQYQPSPSAWSQPGYAAPNYGAAPRRKSGKGLFWVLAGGGIFAGLILLVVCGGIGVYFMFAAVSPSASYAQMTVWYDAGQYGQVWDRFDRKTQEFLGPLLQLSVSFAGTSSDPELRELKDKSHREIFIYMQKKQREKNQNLGELLSRQYTVLSESIEGDVARLEIKTAAGQTGVIYMVREDSIWKFSIVQTMEKAMPGSTSSFPRR